ncbi:alpha/beta hydrolase [Bacillus spongiae]|uniref:Alpha/beta hydrolase n=1 Tax=Bacillus spongiae TaxID=2683610 RepID=A0ABU8HE87_9BACI
MKQALLLPGWGMEKDVFCSLIEAFEERVEFTFIDWRGIKTKAEYEARVISTLRDMKDKVHLVGWSLGSIVALNVVNQVPEKVAGIIIIGGTSRFTIGDDYAYGWHKRIVNRMKTNVKRDKDQTLRSFDLAMFSETEHKQGYYDQFVQIRNEQFQGDSTDSLEVGLQYLIETDVRNILPIIKVPCLIIHGEEDGITPVEAGKFINEQVGSESSIYVLQDTGHMPFFTKADKCAQLMREFME